MMDHQTHGDEVLTGKIVNSNFSYMSQKLEDVGLSVRWGTTVGDDRETLLQAFQQAATRADAVIVNGGLGPTVDDLSRKSPRRPQAVSWCSTRSGSRGWRISSTAAAA
jgi:nicotinamide-nucleotide amidase